MTDKSVKLISEVLKTAKLIGVKKTLEANISARITTEGVKSQQTTRARKERIICTHACSLFTITYKELIKKHGRHPEKAPAQMLVVAYLTKHMDYDFTTAAEILDLHNSYASHMMKKFNYLHKNTLEDKDLLDKYDKLVDILKDKLQL